MIKNSRLLTLASYLAMLFLGVGGAIIGAAARDIGLSAAEIGLLLAVQNFGFGVAVLWVGGLADTYPKPRLLLVGSLVLAPAFLLLYRSPLFWVNAWVMLAIGLGSGAYEGVTDAMLFELHRARAGLHINVNHFFVTIGAIGITVYLLFLQADWRTAMSQAGVGVLALALLFALTAVPTQVASEKTARIGLPLLGRERTLAWLFVAVMLAVGVEAGGIGLLTTFLAELRGFTAATARLGMVVFLVGMATGRLVIGFIAQPAHLLRLIRRLFAIGAVLFAALVLVDPGPLIWPLLYLTGLGASGLLPLILTLAGLRYPERAGAVMGLLKVAIPIGGAGLPFAFSIVVGAASLSTAMLLFPAALVGGLAATLAVEPRAATNIP